VLDRHGVYRAAASTWERNMSLSGMGSCSYELDDDLRIIAVDAAWSEFAIANGAPELVPPPGPLGQPVLSYVADLTTTLLYEQLFSKAQRTGDRIAVPFRCDAPSLRRFLELQIERRFPSGLLLHSTVLRVEERSEVPLLDRRQPRHGELLKMCSFCKSVEFDGRWCQVEEVVVALRLFERDVQPSITHGLCPPCYRRALAFLED
jgi:hypothetical protein